MLEAIELAEITQGGNREDGTLDKVLGCTSCAQGGMSQERSQKRRVRETLSEMGENVGD